MTTKEKTRRRVATHRKRQKERAEMFKALLETQGGVKYVLSPVGKGLHITYILTERAQATLKDYAANERGVAFEDLLREMDAKLLAHLLEGGLVDHDVLTKPEEAAE